MIISLARTIILYFFVIFALRMMGKRQIGELQPSELVITILVSELATLPMQDLDIPVLSGVIPIITLVFLELFMSYLCLKNIKLRRFLNGNPCIVINEGKINRKLLGELRISIDELLEELRINNITEICDVRYAIIETNGQLSYVLYPEARSVTAKMMKTKAPDSALPLVIVNDGYILLKNLEILKKDTFWLEKYLKSQGNININNIFIMTLDACDNIFLQTKED